MNRLRTLTARMVFSHILVAILTSIIAVLALVLLLSITMSNITAADYRGLAQYRAIGWLFGEPDGQPNPEGVGMPEGFNLVVSPENVVLYSQGDTLCRSQMTLADCAPQLVNLSTGERFFDFNGERWAEVVIDTVLGQRVIAHRGPAKAEPAFALGDVVIYGTGPFMFVTTSAMALLSVPVALLLAWLLARPQTRRLSNIARASRSFSEGQFNARVGDHHQDEVGKLAQQFDDMADTLEQNIYALRDLAQRNAELAQQAEQAAIQAERVRLSRDLHDAIAQRLFSLSVSTATLPDIIQKSQEKGIQQSKAIAALAEQTLLDLRALLVELRPSSVIQRGLAEAIQTLCEEWQNVHHIPVECSLMLTGKHIPATVEDILYRVTQEALGNIAKHAQANTAHVSVLQGQHQITLSVTDNGQGFDPTAVTSEGKFGLVSMQERARSVGGNLTIESDTRRGTTLRVVLPVKTDQKDMERNGHL